MKNKGLGRGLGALLDVNTEIAKNEEAKEMPVLEADILDIDVDAAQPRKDFDAEKLDELKRSIEEHGILQPLLVKKVGDRYKLIAGERRYRAARLAGLKKVPITIREADEKTSLALSLIENIQRADLNPVEEAMAIRSLIDEFAYTQEEAAARLAKSRSAIANALRLLILPEELQELVARGSLSAGHARAILMVEDESMRKEAADKIISDGLSVRQAEDLARAMNAAPVETKKAERAPRYHAPEFVAAERELSEKLDTKVRITGSPTKGKLSIEYTSAEQLQSLYEFLIFNGRE
ncbi:MAG: ParB/RepB/Spo0J family partition protein [Christensenellaceae bacterium]|nr:ParB/RepB/Spo0J family partition protein [Christensenellaceae bacterium]